ncbi:MAG: hypothetical protein H9949_11810 [Candidatus Phocaeicola merdigallinarum]|nr:hypothetical protein [Candidatus Phocaeicola merdigallinarum]
MKELLSLIKGDKPCYFIQYTVQDGEIIILDGHKSYPTDGGKHPDLIWGDAMAELRPNEEVIAKFEKDGIDWNRAQEIREKLLNEKQ